MSIHALAVAAGLIASFAACARQIQRDPVYRETEVRLSRPRISGEIFDAQEFDPALRQIFASADLQAERAVRNVPRGPQFIVEFWKAKRKILSDQYGIQWKSPAELNPSIEYANYGQPRITDAESQFLRKSVATVLTSATETISGITRSFEGVASVWTHDHETGLVREYRFAGHDETWTFLKMSMWVD